MATRWGKQEANVSDARTSRPSELIQYCPHIRHRVDRGCWCFLVVLHLGNEISGRVILVGHDGGRIKGRGGSEVMKGGGGRYGNWAGGCGLES
jgi:hypothetical protein